MELKDTVVGYTDESGVTLPPLHPRCRCAIMYKEILSPNVGSSRRTRHLTEKEAEAARVDEEAAFNAKTGADFGFKKMKRSPKWSDEILLTNATAIATPNCQRCVVAHEARMRGYDVVARPSWGANDPLHYSWLKAFDFSYGDFKVCVGKTGEDVIKSVEEIMRSFGEGSRAIIIFKWNADKIMEGKGHVIVAQCREHGAVNFGDPQSGERFARNKLKSADFAEKVILLRTDNLEFTDAVKRCCKNKE